MTTKHTPGEWKPERDFMVTSLLYIYDANGRIVAQAHSLLDGKNNEKLEREQTANGNLIAAAPKMFETLRQLAMSGNTITDNAKHWSVEEMESFGQQISAFASEAIRGIE